MNDCPCGNCEKRSVECHGKCVEYKEWSRKNTEIKEKIYNRKQVDNWICEDLVRNRIKRRKKRGL